LFSCFRKLGQREVHEESDQALRDPVEPDRRERSRHRHLLLRSRSDRTHGNEVLLQQHWVIIVAVLEVSNQLPISPKKIMLK
jgi:hypothetical protein